MNDNQAENPLICQLRSLRLFLLHPTQFFSQSSCLADYRGQLLVAAPPIVIFAIGKCFMSHSLFMFPAAIFLSYLGLGIWLLVLKYVLLFFGEKHDLHELMHITAFTARAFLIAWLPTIGLPTLYILTGFWTFHGLIGYLHMNRGAAMAAVALPVVICGFLGTVLSFVLLWIASITTIFGH